MVYPSYYGTSFIDAFAYQETQARVQALIMQMQLQDTSSRSWFGDIPPPPLEPTHEGEPMSIDVGKIVTRKANEGPYEIESEENVSIRMSEQCISLNMSNKTMNCVDLTSEQAIELGQLLLKAAEVQAEYAAEAARLREETAKLGTKYKDMISGLGLETEVDIVDSRGTFKVIEASA